MEGKAFFLPLPAVETAPKARLSYFDFSDAIDGAEAEQLNSTFALLCRHAPRHLGSIGLDQLYFPPRRVHGQWGRTHCTPEDKTGGMRKGRTKGFKHTDIYFNSCRASGTLCHWISQAAIRTAAGVWGIGGVTASASTRHTWGRV